MRGGDWSLPHLSTRSVAGRRHGSFGAPGDARALGVVWTAITIAMRLAVRPLRGSPFWMITTRICSTGSIRPAHLCCRDRRYLVRATLRCRGETRNPGGARARAQDCGSRTTAGGGTVAEPARSSSRYFLFNALNTISAFTESDPRMARRLMAQLGDLLRASLRRAAAGDAGGRIDVSRRLPRDRIRTLRGTPPGLIAPQTMTCCRGWCRPSCCNRWSRMRFAMVSARPSGAMSKLRHRSGAGLPIRVRDDGVGLPPGWSFERDAGVGLRNVSARLGHLCGRPGLIGSSHGHPAVSTWRSTCRIGP